MSHPLDELLKPLTHSNEIDDVLIHYGVKGMKWDEKRKVTEYGYDDSKDKSNDREYQKEVDHHPEKTSYNPKKPNDPKPYRELRDQDLTDYTREANAYSKAKYDKWTKRHDNAAKMQLAKGDREGVKRKKANEYGYEKKKSKLSMAANRIKGKMNLSIKSVKNAKSTAWKATSEKAKKIGKFIDGLFGR